MASSTQVARKYLCSAPRPDSWDDYAESVLENLGNNAEHILQHTIERIRVMHQIQPKNGPGRKSNAEHAIHFYEYLLEKIRVGEKDDKKEDDGPYEEEDKEEAVVVNDKEAGKPSDFAGKHNEKCEICEDKSGDLLNCSTCSHVFHLPCVRPNMNEFPEDIKTWRCAYCVLSTEPKNTKPRRVAAAAVRLMARLRNQHKRNRKAGGGREREETKTVKPPEAEKEKPQEDEDEDKKENPKDSEDRKEKPQGGDDKKETPQDSEDTKEKPQDSEDKKEKPQDSDLAADESKKEAVKNESEAKTPEKETEKVESTESESLNAEENDSEEKSPSTPNSKKRNLSLYKIQDGLSPAFKVDESGRGKRSRKQPTLYDPQSVPARRWLSDEKKKDGGSYESDHEENDVVMNEPEDDTKEVEEMQKSRRANRERSDSIWCNFCRDDPTIKVCCFCACRVCFGKHNQTKLLLCDMCDDEYHTVCLDPPLSSVPSEKWFCPSCIASQEKRIARTSSRTRGSGKKKEPDPPPSPRRASTRTAAVVVTAPVTIKLPIPVVEEKPPEKRPRGRPPKNKSVVSSTSTGKRRGRPPKSSKLPPPPTGPPRKRGRPPKIRPPPPPPPPVEEPAKLAATESATNALAHKSEGSAAGDSSGSLQSSYSIKVSRSGRVSKRSSFHDEIDEGEQHLRSLAAAAAAGRISAVAVIAGNAAQTAETDTGLPLPTFESAQPDSIDDMQGIVRSKAPLREQVVPAAEFDKTPPPEKRVAISQADDTMRGALKQAAAGVIPPTPVNTPMLQLSDPNASLPATLRAAATALSAVEESAAEGAGVSAMDCSMDQSHSDIKVPRRKPGARECMQMSRRFGARVISDNHMDILLDYCQRGKVEHLIRMRERLDDHSRFLEMQLAGLETLVKEKGESDITVTAFTPKEEGKTS
jgi:hypothetical protein